MKIRLVTIISLAAGITTIFFGCKRLQFDGAGNHRLVVTLASGMNPNTKLWEPAHLLKQELEKASPMYGIKKGEIKVKFYDQGSIGSEKDLLETTFFGVTDIVQINTSVVTTVEPSFAILNLPYLFKNNNQVTHILHGRIGQELLNKLQEHGLQGLSFFSAGFRHMFYRASQCAQTPKELNGLKIRVMQSPIMIKTINAMGPSATPIPFSELYQSIRTGVVDGAENSINLFVASQFYEAGINCFTYTQHSHDQHVLIANKKWLNSLEPKYRNRIVEVSKKIVPTFNQIWKEATKQAIKKIKNQGVTINKIENKKIYVDRVSNIVKQFLKHHSAFSKKLYAQIKEKEKKLTNVHSIKKSY